MRTFKTLLTLCLFALIYPGIAQEIEIKTPDLDQSIPVNKDIRIGKLDNGFTYFIRKNAKPEQRVELRLIVKAGSILEDEDQLGVAHFVEHMAFNGSKNFEKNELVDYLQSVGVQFGADLNAYTSFDQTVYMLPIPTDDPEIVSKGLLVLEDWAGGVSFSDEEIEKERGVVIEEWRLGRGANQRMMQKWMPLALKDSRYAERLPIGTKESLETFDNDAVRRFYNDWYRPDLMAIVAVGDIDVDEMEEEIKSRFGKLKNPAKPRERVEYGVPDHDETFVVVATDPEASFTQIQLVYKHDKKEETTLNDYRSYIVRSVYNGMLGMRLRELTQAADPPFIFASSSYGGFIGPKDSYSSFAAVSETGIKRGLKTLIEENERVLQHGFTESELERYKLSMLNRYERSYNERDKTNSINYTFELINAFLENEPIPGIEFEYNFVKEILPGISVDEVNELAPKWIRDKSRIVIVTGPEKEGLVVPTEEELAVILRESDGKAVDPYAEEEIATSLITEEISAGKVVDTKEIAELEVTEWKLSNGITIVLKPTDFKNDQVLMTGFAMGGTSLYDVSELESASNSSAVVAEGGVGDFTPTDLSKYLSGKTVSAGLSIGTFAQSAYGNSTPKDLETMFELLYARFTNPRKDPKAFESYKNKNKMMFQNMMSNPSFYFQDQVQKIVFDNHPRLGGFPTPEKLDKIDYDRAFEIYQDRFSDASGFTFVFVGNFTLEGIKPLIEKYLGSLPSKNRNEYWEDPGYRRKKGVVDEVVYKGKDPKSQVNMMFTGDYKYTPKSAHVISSLGEALSIRLIEILREDISGVYGAGASGRALTFPYPAYLMSISFPCGPENVDKLVKAAEDEIRNFQENGIPDEVVQKVKEQQKRNREESLKENRYWLNSIRSAYYFKRDLNNINKYDDLVESLTADDLHEAAKKYFDFKNYTKIVLMPEED